MIKKNRLKQTGSKGGRIHKRPTSLPQIGSIADMNKTHSISNDSIGGVQTEKSYEKE